MVLFHLQYFHNWTGNRSELLSQCHHVFIVSGISQVFCMSYFSPYYMHCLENCQLCSVHLSWKFWAFHMNQLWVLSCSTFLIVIFSSNYYRVTCRDWFQLSLKEGLTVFRDQVRILLKADLFFAVCLSAVYSSVF